MQKLNIHNTPQHAGVTECRNWTIGERLWALLHASGLPKFLWGEAACHIVWLLNRMMKKAVEGMMPFEAAFGKKPDLKNIHEWGEKVYVRIEGGTKLGGRVHEGQWLGIDNKSKGACIYWPENKSVTVERNIYHNNTSGSQNDEENEWIGITRNMVPIIQPAPVIKPPVNHDKSTQESEGNAPGVQKPSDDWMAVVEACEDEHAFVIEVQEAEALEPRNLKEVKGHSDWLLWEKAIEEELKSLREAGTWEVVIVTKDANVVGLKWVFKAKKDTSGNVV